MAKPDWGSKRLCQNCGASFYDLRRDPAVCPKCETEFKPVVQQRPQRQRSSSESRAPAPGADIKAAAKEVEAAEARDKKAAAAKAAETKDEVADAVDVEVAEAEAGDDDNAIEDASELGEDKDDMFEVIDNVEKKDES